MCVQKKKLARRRDGCVYKERNWLGEEMVVCTKRETGKEKRWLCIQRKKLARKRDGCVYTERN